MTPFSRHYDVQFSLGLMHARGKAVLQVTGILAALWLLPAPGILLVLLFRGWTPSTVEMVRTIYGVFAVLFTVGVVGTGYRILLEYASDSARGQSFFAGVSSLCGFWLLIVIGRLLWQGLAHISFSTTELLITAAAVTHLVLWLYVVPKAKKET